MHLWKGVVFLILFSLPLMATRNYDSVPIPGAFCGDGSPYKVFVETRSNSRLAFKMQGGGACWSHFTCFTLGTSRSSIPAQPKDTQGFSSNNSVESPVADFSYVYFPYCTGDVHLGTHVASYKDKQYIHLGRLNMKRAIDYLFSEGFVDASYVNEFVFYGSSAGAIGAIYHMLNVAPYFSHVPRKTLILDSPGLHFGESFWYTFSDELFYDMEQAISKVGYRIDKSQGVIADVIPLICQTYSDWEVGVIQTTRDRTMSLFFGGISQGDHRDQVLGARGIYHLTENPYDNCSAFVPESSKHVLMNKGNKLDVSAGGKDVVQFTYELIQEGAGSNYY